MSSKKTAKHSRSASASGKSSHELWLNAVKSRTGGRGTDTFTGLKQPSNEMSYMSTSHYMRQILGTEKPKLNSSADMTGKPMKGTPAYKSQEDYYDEILDLRKQVASGGNENTTLKARIRRLEEDNGKKEKEIDQLLNPARSDDIRRTMTDRKADTGAVIHGLKQKILKLENQVKDKESSLGKLQNDLKTTKVDEMRLQTEAYYQEVVRLRSTPNDKLDSRKQMSKENPSKVKALNDTILRMNEKNMRLTSENRTLKEDLEKMMDEISQQQEKQSQYNDMNKKQLVDTIAKLEKKMAKKDVDSVSMVSADGNIDTKGKVKLAGSLAERLEQLDQRETDLLEENEKQRNIIKRLKEDREHYRNKCDDKSKEIKSLKKEVEILESELNSFYEKDKHGTPRSARHVSPRSARPPSGEHQTTPRSSRPSSARSNSKLTRRLSSESLASQSSEKDRQRKMKDFLENRAAKNIQKNWKSHKTRQEEDEAATLIQSAWSGHKTRKHEIHRMRRGHDTQEDDVTDDNSGLEDAAETIQSAYRGHVTRKQNITNNRISDNDSAVLAVQCAVRGHWARQDMLPNNRSPRARSRGYDKRVTNGLDSEGGSEEEIEEDIPSRSTPPSSRRPSLKRRDSATSSSSRTGRNVKRESPRPQATQDSEDDDDDICF